MDQSASVLATDSSNDERALETLEISYSNLSVDVEYQFTYSTAHVLVVYYPE